MDITTSVKTALRINHDKLDSEIGSCISAAKTAMLMAGIHVIDDEDDYTSVAIMTFARSWFNFQGDGERYGKLFEMQLAGMSMNAKYNTEAEDGSED